MWHCVVIQCGIQMYTPYKVLLTIATSLTLHADKYLHLVQAVYGSHEKPV